jgi:hypothetical protein
MHSRARQWRPVTTGAVHAFGGPMTPTTQSVPGPRSRWPPPKSLTPSRSEFIHFSTYKNPIQVFVDAVINTGPCEDSPAKLRPVSAAVEIGSRGRAPIEFARPPRRLRSLLNAVQRADSPCDSPEQSAPPNPLVRVMDRQPDQSNNHTIVAPAARCVVAEPALFE